VEFTEEKRGEMKEKIYVEGARGKSSFTKGHRVADDVDKRARSRQERKRRHDLKKYNKIVGVLILTRELRAQIHHTEPFRREKSVERRSRSGCEV